MNADKPQLFNIASLLRKRASEMPDRIAVMAPVGKGGDGKERYEKLSFLELERESDRMARGLNRAGVTMGVRTILMVRPGLDFFALVFALFKTGAVPVVVDPGMGLRRMFQCFRESRPSAFIGIPLAHAVRKFKPSAFKSVETWITVGRRWFWGGYTLDELRNESATPYEMAPTGRDDPAAILFTTGSTGPAKGTVYTHGIFGAQIAHIAAHWKIAPGEIDLPTFPLFALFDPALGMTAVIPRMDPTKPAEVDPENIIGPIREFGITNMFASPALLHRVGRYGREKGVRLPSLKRVISAGAPVAPANIEQFSTMLSDGAEVHTPYGATEVVPIVSIEGSEILSETRALTEQGYGICVGRPLEGVEIRIIRIGDEPIAEWSDDLALPDGEIGEIAASAEHVTKEYFERPRRTALAKIYENGRIWHRMGDVGWRDDRGRIWFCGRKDHRVITADWTMFTIPCEAVFNNHPNVYRSALVGVGLTGAQKPVICIELEPGDRGADKDRLARELLALAHDNERTKSIGTVLFHKSFPVDVRHNAKIYREKLTGWAEEQVRRGKAFPKSA